MWRSAWPCRTDAVRALEMCCAPVTGLHRPTLGFLVVDDDSGPLVELFVDLEDFGGERDVMFALVSTLTGYKRFNDTV